jgi:tetratricopeptide (TPR) repeat protein
VKKFLPLVLPFFAALLLAGCAARIDEAASREKTALAQSLERSGNAAEAEAAYKEALRADRYNETALWGLARLYLNTDEAGKAMPLLDRVIARAGKRTPPDIAAESASLIISGRAREAESLLEGALDKDPSRSDLRLLLAAACVKGKQFARAVREIQSVPLEAAGGAESLAQKAAAALGLDETSLKILLWEAWSNYLRSLNRSQWSPEADEAAATAEKYFPQAAHFKACRARLLYLHGEKEQALALMAGALEMDPFDMEVVREARYVYVCERRYADALAVWKRAAPQSFVFAPDNLIKRRLDALQSFTQEASEKRDDAGAQCFLAMAYRHVGWLEEAAAQAEIARGIDPQNQDAVRETLLLYKHERFLERIKELTGYLYDAEIEDSASPSLAAIAASLRGIAKSEGIVLADSPDEIYCLPLYGCEIHVFNRDKSALAAYFLEFGEYLQLSRIYEPPFCQIMNIIAWFKDGRGIDAECVICDEDRVRSLLGYAFNHPVIAGHSTLSRAGFYADFDALRPDLRAVRSAEAALKGPETGGEAAGFYSDAGRDALLARLLSGADASSDDAVFQRLSEVALDGVMYHEYGHVVDLRRFVPLYAHIPAHFIEGFRAGLSPSNIRDRMELRAETYSLAHSPEPAGVILSNLLRLQADGTKPRCIDYLLYYMPLEEKGYSPYLSGAGRMLEFARKYLEQESGGTVSPAETASLLSKMAPEELNAIGEAMLREEGMK